MNILFIHGNYPAQFRHLASDLGGQKCHDVRFLTARKDTDSFPIDGVTIERYEDISENASDLNTKAQTIINQQVRRGESVQVKIAELVSQGFVPKLIIFHGGNGLSLFLKQLLPNTVTIGYFEWYFTKRCAHLILNRDDVFSYNLIHSRNLCTENEILNCDAGIIPTEWQSTQFPNSLRKHLNIIFDGVDLQFFKPAERDIFNEQITIEGEDNKLKIYKDDLVLTYATRGMEPLRGFPQFMRALPVLLNKFENLKVLIGGRDRSAYGPSCPKYNGSWKEMMLSELPKLRNHPRIKYIGLMNYENYRLMLQRTNLHVYLTQPYVTSWSLFEAAACGTPLIRNESAATNGTIAIPNEYLLKSIDEIYEPSGIEKASNILKQKRRRNSFLQENLSLANSKKKWADLINKTLSQKI